MTFKTLSDRAADYYEHVQANPYVNIPKFQLDGVSRGDGFILVKTVSDASAYPPDKVITHDSPLRRKGRVVAIDSEYAAELMYDLASTLDRERRESAATIAALQKEIARTDAQIDALLKAAKPTVAQKQYD